MMKKLFKVFVSLLMTISFIASPAVSELSKTSADASYELITADLKVEGIDSVSGVTVNETVSAEVSISNVEGDYTAIIGNYNEMQNAISNTTGSTLTNCVVTIPDKITYNGNDYTVTEIEDMAFQGCKYITDFKYETPGNIHLIGFMAFEGCTALEKTHVDEMTSLVKVLPEAYKGDKNVVDDQYTDNNGKVHETLNLRSRVRIVGQSAFAYGRTTSADYFDVTIDFDHAGSIYNKQHKSIDTGAFDCVGSGTTTNVYLNDADTESQYYINCYDNETTKQNITTVAKNQLTQVDKSFVDNVSVIATYVPMSYGITNNLSHVTASEMTADKVTYNTDWSEKLTADKNYNNVTVTSVTGVAAGGWTFTDGSLKITGTAITGEVTVNASADKIVYNAAMSADSSYVSTDTASVEAGNDYSATLSTANNYVTMPASITVTVNGAVLSTDKYTYTIASGNHAATLVIKADNITGDIVIKANGVADKYDVAVSGDTANYTVEPAAAVGTDKAQYGADWTAVIKPASKYKLDETNLTITCDSATLVKGTDYTVSDTGNNNVTITIKGSSIKGDLDLNILTEPITLNVTFKNSDSHLKLDKNTFTCFGDYTGTMTADAGYTLPDSVDVLMDGASVKNVEYDSATGKLTVKAATADLVIDAEAAANSYTMDTSGLTNLSIDNSQMTCGTDFTATLKSEGYTLPQTITITRGGQAFTDFTYDPNTGSITIKGDKITDEFAITATAGAAKTYKVKLSGDNVNMSNRSATFVTYGKTWSVLVKSDEGCANLKLKSITQGSRTLALDIDYTITGDASSGYTVTLLAGRIKGDGDVTIYADSFKTSYKVTLVDNTEYKSVKDERITMKGREGEAVTSVLYNTSLILVVESSTCYDLSTDNISIMVGNRKLVEGTDYYIENEMYIMGVMIYSNEINDNVTVTVKGVAAKNTLLFEENDDYGKLSCTDTGENVLTYGEVPAITPTISVSDEHLGLPDTIDIVVDEDTLVAGTDYTYDPATGKIVFTSSGSLKFKDAVVIQAKAKVVKDCDVVLNDESLKPMGSDNYQTLTLTPSGTGSVKYFENYTGTLKAGSNYHLTADSVESVKLGTRVLTSGTDYTYTMNVDGSGTLMIPKVNINDTLTITAKALPDSYSLEFFEIPEAAEAMTMSNTGKDAITFGQPYTAKITNNKPKQFKQVSKDRLIILTSDYLIEGTDYTYNETTGVIEITAAGSMKLVGNSAVIVSVDEVDRASIEYSAHIQNTGWSATKKDGELVGTAGGDNDRIEAIKLDIKDSNYSGSVKYSVYTQDQGWNEEKTDGETAGTIGQSRRVEAIKGYLTGDVSQVYSLFYRVYVEGYGWMGWTNENSAAGTTGMSKRIEAVQFVLCSSFDPLPYSDTQTSFVAGPTLTAHVQNLGWMPGVGVGATCGTTGQGLRLEAFKIGIGIVSIYTESIEYSVHVQDVGWMSKAKNGETAGTTGQSKRIEAIKIKMSGYVSEDFSISYRTHIQNMGWTGWSKDGEVSGTTGKSLRMEAIQLKLVKKVIDRDSTIKYRYSH